jgi:hypothetical protein
VLDPDEMEALQETLLVVLDHNEMEALQETLLVLMLYNNLRTYYLYLDNIPQLNQEIYILGMQSMLQWVLVLEI